MMSDLRREEECISVREILRELRRWMVLGIWLWGMSESVYRRW